MPADPEERIYFFIAMGMLPLMAVGLTLIVWDTIRRRGRWGINFKGLAGLQCPRCREPLPVIRVPKSLRETLWGGCTCKKCGCQVDKWGEPIRGQNLPAGPPGPENRSRGASDV